jgi:hypothetical protein
MSIVLKRHHRERLKNKRRNHWGRDLINEPKHLAKAVNTPTPCSCFRCANKRSLYGKTRKEQLADMDLHSENNTNGIN